MQRPGVWAFVIFWDPIDVLPTVRRRQALRVVGFKWWLGEATGSPYYLRARKQTQQRQILQNIEGVVEEDERC